jgi:hypothetical protein
MHFSNDLIFGGEQVKDEQHGREEDNGRGIDATPAVTVVSLVWLVIESKTFFGGLKNNQIL